MRKRMSEAGQGRERPAGERNIFSVTEGAEGCYFWRTRHEAGVARTDFEPGARPGSREEILDAVPEDS